MSLMKRIKCVENEVQALVNNREEWTHEKIASLHQELDSITDSEEFGTLNDKTKRDIKYLKSHVRIFLPQDKQKKLA